jgi:hypothetical protein
MNAGRIPRHGDEEVVMAVSGTWYSAVGSRLELKEKGSELHGTFDSTESSTGKPFPLHGSVDPDTSLKNRALSFSVAWIDKSTPPTSKNRSVTSYTGQYHNDKGVETIQVVFLLANETTPAKAYASVFVGSDIFTRTKP